MIYNIFFFKFTTQYILFQFWVKFGLSEKGTKFKKNLPLKIWRYWVTSNFKWKIFWNFVPFSESPNFTSIRDGLSLKLMGTYPKLISSTFASDFMASERHFRLKEHLYNLYSTIFAHHDFTRFSSNFSIVVVLFWVLTQNWKLNYFVPRFCFVLCSQSL